MSYDPDSLSDREADADTRCPRCKGQGFTCYDPDNPRACEPCGCDEPDEDEADVAQYATGGARG